MDLEWVVQTSYMEALLSELVRFPHRCLVGFGFTHPPVNSGFRNIAEREAERGGIHLTQLPILGATLSTVSEVKHTVRSSRLKP